MALTDFNVYLETNYGLDYTLGVTQLGGFFPGATNADKVDAAGVVFPWFLAYCSCDSARFGVGAPDRVPTPGAPQWTDADILELSYAVAAHNDALWATGGAIGEDWYFGGPTLSRANIIWPHGSYYINYPLILAYGTYEGQGSSQYAPDLNNPLNEVVGGTRLSIWHEEWIDLPNNDNGPVKHIFQSLNWPTAVGGTLYAGVLGATGGGADVVLAVYMEGCRVRNFKFDGRKSMAPEAVDGGEAYVTTYEDAAVAIWRAGSCSAIYDCQSDFFNSGIYQLPGATPGFIQNCRGFDSNLASLWQRGDGFVTAVGYECDESVTTFLAGPFVDPTNPANNLMTPGGQINAHGVKIETGTSGVSTRYKGTMLFDGQGWCVGVFNGVGYAGTNMYPDLLCRIEPYPPSLTGTESYVSVDGLKIFGYVRSLMHHADAGDSKKFLQTLGEYTTKYAAPTKQFTYNSIDGGTISTNSGSTPPQKEVPYENLMNPLTNPLAGATFDDTVDPGTPERDNPPFP